MASKTLGKDVPVTEIVSTIFDCKTNSQAELDRQWHPTGIRMGLTSGQLNNLRRLSSSEGRYVGILEAWVQKKVNVTVADLIHIFKKVNLNGAADCLEKTYGSPSTEPTQLADGTDNPLLGAYWGVPWSLRSQNNRNRSGSFTSIFKPAVKKCFLSQMKNFWMLVKGHYVLASAIIALLLSLSANVYLTARCMYCSAKNSSADKFSTSEVTSQTTHGKILCQRHGEPFVASLDLLSIVDLPSALRTLRQPNINLTLTIATSDWTGEQINATNTVVSHLILRGNIGSTLMIELFRIFANVVSLVIDNTNGAMCQNEIAAVITPLTIVEMKCLNSLMISSVSRCSQIFSLMERNTLFPELQHFYVRNSNIDSKNLLSLQNVLDRSTLNTIELSLQDFNGIKIPAKTKSNIVAKHVYLESLMLGPILLQKSFCDIFKSIQSLRVKTGYLIPEHLALVANCRTIVNISTAVYFESHKSMIEISDLRVSSTLRNLSMIFLFETCPEVDDISFMIGTVCTKVAFATFGCEKCPLAVQDGKKIRNTQC